MAVLYAGEEGVKLRGTLAGFFFIGTFVSIAALLVAGKFGTTEVLLAMGLVPGIVAGFALSGRLDFDPTTETITAPDGTEVSLDAPVGQVPHPAGDVETLGDLLGCEPEADPLDVPIVKDLLRDHPPVFHHHPHPSKPGGREELGLQGIGERGLAGDRHRDGPARAA